MQSQQFWIAQFTIHDLRAERSKNLFECSKMAAITLIEADSATQSGKADLIFADPPFDLPGDVLAEILQRYDAPHLVLIATMRQILAFASLSPWAFSFDFVLDGVMPKQSKSRQQPNYTHQTRPISKSRRQNQRLIGTLANAAILLARNLATGQR
ncbi:MAG: hypothetical protein IPI57_13805, partial [Candidatus Competibacteraceae bacterium]|nr:hypothetical protein [Candidatus Competibacteraceae bacterium]